MVASPARGQLYRENEHSPVPVRACENLASRDGFSRRVPRQPVHSPLPRLNLVLTYGIPPEFRGGVHLFL